MTQLINLLSWLPGHSGFGSYVQRVVPGIDGLRLQLGEAAQAALLTSAFMFLPTEQLYSMLISVMAL